MTEEGACTSPEARQFDFWIGDWELSWADGGRGTNRIEAAMNGCVILENFDGQASIQLTGMSVSVYSPALNTWRQTWVDNQGNYLDFSGGWKDGRMILARDAVERPGNHQQRMVWYNISTESLEWNWERSEDGGQTWQVLWHIQYQRRGS